MHAVNSCNFNHKKKHFHWGCLFWTARLGSECMESPMTRGLDGSFSRLISTALRTGAGVESWADGHALRWKTTPSHVNKAWSDPKPCSLDVSYSSSQGAEFMRTLGYECWGVLAVKLPHWQRKTKEEAWLWTVLVQLVELIHGEWWYWIMVNRLRHTQTNFRFFFQSSLKWSPPVFATLLRELSWGSSYSGQYKVHETRICTNRIESLFCWTHSCCRMPFSYLPRQRSTLVWAHSVSQRQCI